MTEDKYYTNVVVRFDPSSEKKGFDGYVQKKDYVKDGRTICSRDAVFINEAEIVFRYADIYLDPVTRLAPWYDVKATGRSFQLHKYNVTIWVESDPVIASFTATPKFYEKIQLMFKDKGINNENIRQKRWIIKKEEGSAGRIARHGIWAIYLKGEVPDPEPPSKKTVSLAQRVRDNAIKVEAAMEFTGEETDTIKLLIESAPEIIKDPPNKAQYIDFFMNTEKGCGASEEKAEWMYKNRKLVGLT